jgi:hypothetical protein
MAEKIVSPLFQSHRVNAEGARNLELVAESFDSLLLYLSKLCPDSREFSIAKTKLEEACFFARKAVANCPENQA